MEEKNTTNSMDAWPAINSYILTVFFLTLIKMKEKELINLDHEKKIIQTYQMLQRTTSVPQEDDEPTLQDFQIMLARLMLSDLGANAILVAGFPLLKDLYVEGKGNSYFIADTEIVPFLQKIQPMFVDAIDSFLMSYNDVIRESMGEQSEQIITNLKNMKQKGNFLLEIFKQNPKEFIEIRKRVFQGVEETIGEQMSINYLVHSIPMIFDIVSEMFSQKENNYYKWEFNPQNISNEIVSVFKSDNKKHDELCNFILVFCILNGAWAEEWAKEYMFELNP